jgi:hypothetical protein
MFLNANNAFECANRVETLAGEGNLDRAQGELQSLKGMYIQIRSLLDAYVDTNRPN